MAREVAQQAKQAFEKWNLTEDPWAEASEAQCFAAGYDAATGKLREEVEIWKTENESRAIWIQKMCKLIGYDNSDGFHSQPDPFEIVAKLRDALEHIQQDCGSLDSAREVAYAALTCTEREMTPDCKCIQQGYPEQDCKWHGEVAQLREENAKLRQALYDIHYIATKATEV